MDYSPWNSPGQNNGVGSLSLLQGNPEVNWTEVKSLSRVQLFVTPWTVGYQDPLSMGFSRQEYWSGLPFPSPGEYSWPRDQTWVSHIVGRRFTIWATREVPSLGDLTAPVIELGSPALQAESLSTELLGRYLKCFFFIPYEGKLKAIFLRIW